MLQVVALNEIIMPRAMQLLYQFRESSLFLLNNLREYGPRRMHHPNSGNFRCVIDEGQNVRAVYCLTNRGTLLIHADPVEDYTPLVLEEVGDEALPVRGFIGPWDIVNTLHKQYCELHPDFRTSFCSREIFYSCPVQNRATTPANPAVRLLTAADFPQWLPLHQLYLKEEGLPVSVTDQQRQALFKERTDRKFWWGCFDGSTLVGAGGINAHFETIGQIGGVVTLPAYRRKGVARAIINRILNDSTVVHHMQTIGIFTGEQNAPAQALYEKMGFQRSGMFGMIYGQD